MVPRPRVVLLRDGRPVSDLIDAVGAPAIPATRCWATGTAATSSA